MDTLLSTLQLAICLYGLYECFHRLTLMDCDAAPWKIRVHLYLQAVTFLWGVFSPMFYPVDLGGLVPLFVVAAHLWSTEAFWRTAIPIHLRSGPFALRVVFVGEERRRSHQDATFTGVDRRRPLQ